MLTSNALSTARFVRTHGTWLAYLSVGLFAFFQATLGPLMPTLREQMGFGYTMASIMFSAMATGLVCMGLVGERITRQFGRRRSFRAALAGLATAVILFMTSPTVGISIVAVFGIGAFGTLMGIAIQAHLADSHPTQRARAITELNLTSSVFAVCATFAVGMAERTVVGWQGAQILGLIALALVAISLRRTSIVEGLTTTAATHRPSGHLPGRFWGFALVIFLGVSVDWCVAFWGADFLHQSTGLSTANAATVMGSFFVAILAGRIVGIQAAGRVDSLLFLRLTLAVMLTGFTLFWLGSTPSLAVAGLFLTGFGTANVFPFAYTAALNAAAEKVDLATSRLALFGGAAVLIPPFTLGLLAGAVGIRWSLAVVPPLLLTALIVAIVLSRTATTSSVPGR